MPKIKAKQSAIAISKAKDEAAKQPFVSASQIIRKHIRKEIEPAHVEALPNMNHILRNVNRHRQKLRPSDPTAKDFELQIESMAEDFLLEDLFHHGERHIIFATKQQLQLLHSAKTWFADGTFKFMKWPFMQLFSIHAFAKSEDAFMQVPLAFCCMSRRQTSDYQAVFEAISRSFLTPPKLHRVILDFEAATWKALKNVFPGVELRGCSFHFTQAVYRHVQSLGLQTAYQENVSVRNYVRKLMALCYIPAIHIRPLFQKLSQEARSPSMQSLIDYMRDTWVETSTFKPESWSVFDLPFRTNNDVEGWHHRMNKRARPNTPFYLMVQLLHNEATDIPMNIELLNTKKIKRRLRKKYAKLNQRMFKLWRQYTRGEKSAEKLLKACSYLVAGCAT